jgi:hypothetical protein
MKYNLLLCIDLKLGKVVDSGVLITAASPEEAMLKIWGLHGNDWLTTEKVEVTLGIPRQIKFGDVLMELETNKRFKIQPQISAVDVLDAITISY